MWDKTRQKIWLTAAVILVTFAVFPLAQDEDGRFDVGYFILLEVIFLVVVGVMFYVYSRKQR